MRPRTIAIDGPAGSGKSTLGLELAGRLGYAMLDAGLLYRLATHQALTDGVPPDDSPALIAAADQAFEAVAVSRVSGNWAVTIGGTEISKLELHGDEITQLVAAVAKLPSVREKVRDVQARVLHSGYAILAGRDIGTVVAPNAELKLYLDVSLAERASRRRWASGPSGLSQTQIESALSHRDELDRSRDASPLQIPDDAVVVRTDQLSVDDAVSALIGMCGLEPVA